MEVRLRSAVPLRCAVWQRYVLVRGLCVKTCEGCGVRSAEACEETTSGSSSRSGVRNERVHSSSQSGVETLNGTKGSSSQIFILKYYKGCMKGYIVHRMSVSE